MKRLLSLVIILVVVLPTVCIYFEPQIKEVDFLTLDLTIFAISVALITFASPLLMNLRGKLMLLDECLIKRDKGILDFASERLNLARLLNSEEEEKIAEAESIIRKKYEQFGKRKLLSDIVTAYFDGLKKIVVICLASIFALVFVNLVLANSTQFLDVAKSYWACFETDINSGTVKYIATTYIELSSLSLQLYLLYVTSIDSISLMKLLNFGETSKTE